MFFIRTTEFPVLLINEQKHGTSYYLINNVVDFIKTGLFLFEHVYKLHENDYGFTNQNVEAIDMFNLEDSNQHPWVYFEKQYDTLKLLFEAKYTESIDNKYALLSNGKDTDVIFKRIASEISPICRNLWVRQIIQEKNIDKVIDLYLIQCLFENFGSELIIEHFDKPC